MLKHVYLSVTLLLLRKLVVKPQKVFKNDITHLKKKKQTEIYVTCVYVNNMTSQLVNHFKLNQNEVNGLILSNLFKYENELAKFFR